MAFFRNNTRRILQEFKSTSDYNAEDLSKDIKESFEDLKSDYEEFSSVVPEFLEFASALKSKLNSSEAQKLEEFSSKLNKVNRCAKNGIEALRGLSLHQKKITKENQLLFEEFE